jgi:hypothetical protein
LTGSNAGAEEYVWSIGIFAGSSPLHVSAPTGLLNPVLTHHHVTDVSASFVADPFMIYVDGAWYMFFEVMVAGSVMGAIGLAVSRDARIWQYRQIVLQEPFHLSYPYVFRWRGTFFMIPETLAADCVRLYRAAQFPIHWSHAADLIPGMLADASIVRHDGRWWIFACGTPYDHDCLRLFHSDHLTGPWREHPGSPLIQSDPRRARPGGRITHWGSQLIRFAQDCRPAYGQQVRAFTITTLTRSRYAEVPAAEDPVLSAGGEPWSRFGMHSIDPHRVPGRKWIACVDGHGLLPGAVHSRARERAARSGPWN